LKVSIIENWSDIEGVVRTVEPSSDAKGFISAEVVLRDVRAVPDFANLLEGQKGQSIPVNFPRQLGERLGLKPGLIFRGRVRQGGSKTYFVHPEMASLGSLGV